MGEKGTTTLCVSYPMVFVGFLAAYKAIIAHEVLEHHNEESPLLSSPETRKEKKWVKPCPVVCSSLSKTKLILVLPCYNAGCVSSKTEICSWLCIFTSVPFACPNCTVQVDDTVWSVSVTPSCP